MEILKFVRFRNLIDFSVKSHFTNSIHSRFDIKLLGDCIIEQNNKIKPFDFPEQDFSILGVDNKVGIFDAYIQKGKEINQPYKIVENGFLAYNPYRINVGSIGLKRECNKYKYISPAYVVFSCKENLYSEFLFLVFKTNIFNQIINENTTGSVRQNLSFNILSNIQIPLPDIDIQKSLVSAYQEKIRQAEILENQASFEFSGYLDEVLGIQESKKEIPNGILLFTQFEKLNKWGVSAIFRQNAEFNQEFLVKKISDLCKVGSGGTPSRSRYDYYQGNIAWVKTGEVVNDVIFETEEYITEQAIENSSAKLYPAGSLVIAMYGQGLTRGRTAKLGINATTNQACAVLSEIKNEIILTDYLWVYLMNEYERLRELASGNNQPNLNAEMIKNYPVIIPNIEMQKKIIGDFFDKKQQQKQAKTQAQILREQAIMEFEQAIFI